MAISRKASRLATAAPTSPRLWLAAAMDRRAAPSPARSPVTLHCSRYAA